MEKLAGKEKSLSERRSTLITSSGKQHDDAKKEIERIEKEIEDLKKEI